MKIFAFFLAALLSFSSLFSVSLKHTPAYRPLIVLDAGHGGWNLGARIKSANCVEKKLTLSTAHFTKIYLEKMGYRVSMTRSNDYYISLPDRVSFANKRKPDLFVSIHFNSCPNKEVHGIEVFYHQNEQNISKTRASKSLASCVLKNSAQKAHFVARGIKDGNYFVIRQAAMPAILVEGGFLTNIKERERLKQRQQLNNLARGIAEGIDLFFRK